MSWLLGFFISSSLWILVNTIWPPPGVGEIDDKDVFGTFGPASRSSSDSVNEEDGDVKDAEKLQG